MFSEPKRGDVIVFKTPADNRTDYIKRLIGLPGDEIQFIDGSLYVNNNQIIKTLVSSTDVIFCGNQSIKVNTFEEKLPNGKKYKATYRKEYSFQNSDKFLIPENHFFFLGDNRDCSKDSRFLSEVGYVHENNLVGKAQILFFSSDYRIGSILKFWQWKEILRTKRFFKLIK
jgi:signal peptidase I